MSDHRIDYYRQMAQDHGIDAVIAFLLGIIDKVKEDKALQQSKENSA